jgi:hypothetical protein
MKRMKCIMCGEELDMPVGIVDSASCDICSSKFTKAEILAEVKKLIKESK